MGSEVKKRGAGSQDTFFSLPHFVISTGDFNWAHHLVQICQDCSLTWEKQDSKRQECLASLKNGIK